jgi:hypothetical protein
MPVATATAAHASGHNCCQAVLRAFQPHFQIDEERIAAARQVGSGRAPNGRCGALHAAYDLIDPTHHAAIENAFVSHAGSANCQQIRELRKVTCRACVAEAARLVAQHLEQGPS